MSMLQTELYKLIVSGHEFFLSAEDLARANIISTSPTQYHLIQHHQTANAVIIPGSRYNKLEVEVDGEFFEVEIKDALQQQLEKMGFDKVSGSLLKEIKAPMPGLVVQVSVTEGQQVDTGDKLMTLEAMKMENSITVKSPVIIKKIWVTGGQAVEKGQVLMEFE